MIRITFSLVLFFLHLYSFPFIKEIDPNKILKEQGLENKDSLPYKVQISNEGLFLNFENGNRAALFVNKLKEAEELQVSLMPIETTCSEKVVSQTCDFISYVVNYKFSLVWIKHSDPKKVNTKVKLKNPSNEADNIETVLTYTWEDLHRSFVEFKTETFPTETKRLLELKRASFSCPNLNWISKKFMDRRVLISEWTSEVMEQNPETGISENRTIQTFQNISGYLRDDKLILEKIDFNPILEKASSLIDGDIVGFTYFSPQGNSCEASFNVDLMKLGREFEKLKKVPDNLKGFSVLKWTSIEQVKSFFESLEEESAVDAPHAKSTELRILKELNLLLVIPSFEQSSEGKIIMVDKVFKSEIE